MVTDARTSSRNYQKPAAGNTVAEDFARLIPALDAIDTDVAGLLSSVAQRALLSHGHAIGDVSGLQAQLDGKSGVGHTHTLDSLSDVNVPSPASGQYLRFVGGQWVSAAVAAAISDVSGLQTALDGKAPVSHSHNIGSITDLATALDNRRPAYRNRVVNGGFDISQERGTNTVDVSSGSNSAYVVDQWRLAMGSGSGVMRGQQIVGDAEANRLRVTVQTTDATMDAGDVYLIDQFIEGAMIADARFGQSTARALVIQFSVITSVAGTYCVSIANGASDQSWVGTYTISALELNVRVTRSIVIPGRTVGTWLRDNGIGLRLRFCLAAGSNFVGLAGWQTGNIVATSAQVNLMATSGATFSLMDVGLYVDTLALGLAPTWEPPALDEELRRCMRYWQTVAKSARGPTGANGTAYLFPVPMRATPDRSPVSEGTLNQATVVTEASLVSARGFYFTISSTSSVGGVFDRVDAFSARMA